MLVIKNNHVYQMFVEVTLFKLIIEFINLRENPTFFLITYIFRKILLAFKVCFTN